MCCYFTVEQFQFWAMQLFCCFWIFRYGLWYVNHRSWQYSIPLWEGRIVHHKSNTFGGSRGSVGWDRVRRQRDALWSLRVWNECRNHCYHHSHTYSSAQCCNEPVITHMESRGEIRAGQHSYSKKTAPFYEGDNFIGTICRRNIRLLVLVCTSICKLP